MLDSSQLEAVNANEGQFLVWAGPGSGKTSCLTHRIARLVKDGIEPSRILAVTFTKNAAVEMAERAGALLNMSPKSLTGTISTFHSLGLRILYRSQKHLGFNLAKDPVKPSRCNWILRKLLSENRELAYYGVNYQIARSYITGCKREGSTPGELLREEPDSHLAKMYSEFEKRKSAEGLIEYEDMIFYSWYVLKKIESARRQWQGHFGYLMIDEFHDTDPVQMDLAMMLAAPENNVWCVCDPLQSIYSWRGADPSICMGFDKYYPNHKKIYLGTNYRSTMHIVTTYKTVIKPSPFAVAEFLDTIKANRDVPDALTPEFKVLGSDTAEAAFVADKAMEARENNRTVAVLYRTNRQSRIIEDEFMRRAVPYVIFGSCSFFERAEVKDVLAYLQLFECLKTSLVDKSEANVDKANEAMERIIRGRAPIAKYLGKAVIDWLAQRGGMWFDNLRYLDTGRRRQSEIGVNLYRTLTNLARDCDHDGVDVDEQLEMILETSGMRGADDDADEGNVSEDNAVEENLAELLKAAHGFSDRGEFLAYVDKFKGRKETLEGNPVRLLTIHKCVSPDTFVETNQGIKKIKDIPSSGFIATPDGMHLYSQKFEYEKSEMLEITTRNGYSLTVTPNHGMTVWDNGAHWKREASLLKVGDWLRLKIGVTGDRSSYVKAPSSPPLGDVRAKAYKLPTEINELMAEFLGLMVADGTIYRMGFRIVKRYRSVIERFRYLAKTLFSARVYVSRANGSDAWAAEVNSVFLSSWLLKFDGVAPNEKSVPDRILSSPLRVQAAFLRGLFEDGTVNLRGNFVDHIHWDNKSLECGRTVQYMLLRFGIISSLKDHASNGHKICTVYIYGNSVTKFADEIGFVSIEKSRRLKKKTYKTERQSSIPVSRLEIKKIRNLLSLFEKQNGMSRGSWSRGLARKIIARDPWRTTFLLERLKWHYVKITSIKKKESASMCVSVPGAGRFLQNGFDGWNSKGLEFNTVFLIGADDKVLPHRLSENVEEERRLAYVAVSRAKDNLFVLSQGVPSKFFNMFWRLTPKEKNEEEVGV